MTEQLDLFLSVAKKAATEACKIQMEYFDKEKQISTKSTETDIVTQVDLLCQEAIIKIIKCGKYDLGFPLNPIVVNTLSHLNFQFSIPLNSPSILIHIKTGFPNT